MGLTFKGTHSSTVAGGNLLINGIERALLPSRTSKTVKVAGRAGAYDFGTEEDVRQYVVTATLTANNEGEREQYLEEVQTWLDGEEGEIIFDSRQQVSYYGKTVGSTDIQPIGTSVILSFTIECADPYGYGIEKEYTIDETEETQQVINDGNAETFPKFTVEFTRSASSIVLSNGDKHVLVGKGTSVEDTAVPFKELVLRDQMVDPNLWNTGGSIDGGTIAGTFASNGYAFYQASKDYGTNANGWHGAAMTRSLPSPAQDFEVTAHMQFQANQVKQVGRVELYLLDANGKHIGKVAIKDIMSNYNWQMAEARAGALSGGQYFIRDYGGTRDVWKNFDYGMLQIGRKGNTWWAYICIKDNKTGKEHTRMWRPYVDISSKYQDQLAAVQLHVGAMKGFTPTNAMFFHELYVYKYNLLGSNQVDQAFQTGDILVVDNEAANVTLNGSQFMGHLDASSDFFSLGAGSNVVGAYPSGIANTTVNFKNRYK